VSAQFKNTPCRKFFSRRSFAPFPFFFESARHKEKRNKKEMPFSGALPLTPPTFLKKSWIKNFSVGCGSNPYNKMKLGGTKGPTSFLLAITQHP